MRDGASARKLHMECFTKGAVMRKFSLVSLALTFALIGAITQAIAADADKGLGTWSVFKEGRAPNATCWAVTANDGAARLNGSLLYVSVTKPPGKALELAIYSDHRFPKSAGMTLTIGQRRYPLHITEKAAWLSDHADKRAIEDLKALETSPGPARFGVSIPALGTFDYSAKGFTAALDIALKSCK